MPAKRTSNVQKGKGTSSRPVSARSQTASDLAGVALIVIALAMGVALFVPSSAPVTYATAEGLRLGFGAGAPLVPVAMALFGVTMFLPTDESAVARVALGLTLVVISILSILSILVPGAASNPDIVLDAGFAATSGGYVGAGVAWTLLTFTGQSVGLVLLVGLAVAGVIVCGFSISNLVQHLGASMAVAAQRLAAERNAHGVQADEPAEVDVVPAQAAAAQDFAENATSFIGGRTTSVLKRHTPAESGIDHATATMPLESLAKGAVAPEPATKLLRRRNKQPETTPRDAPDTNDTKGRTDVPDFLAAAAKAADEKSASAAKTRRSQQTASESNARPGDTADDFKLPPMTLLKSNPNSANSASSDAELERTAKRLQATLEEFGLTSRVSGWTSGPLVTTFKVEMGEGERVSKITNLQDDIQLSLASESVRIFAPIPGTSLVGIEIPNKRRQNVCLGDVLPFAQGGPLEFAIGRDSEGAPVVADLARMPHMLVAGTTGSGKSVLINSIIMSLVMRTAPEQVRLILVDPKRVEFSCYAGLPHLYVPVVTEPRQAASALQWAVTEMDRRLKVFERAGARDVQVYNRLVASGTFADQENPPKQMPYLVIVIDELSDLMMVAGKDVEASIVRIAQLARAAGIHLVLATQRPSADVVTGLIKSNVDTRVALKVSSSIDSRVILDQTGAERLMGRGDMLFRRSGGVLRRVLGAYSSDAEIASVISFIRDQRETDYHDEILSAVVPGQTGPAVGSDTADDDPLVWEAAQMVVDSRLGSTSGLQRRLKVGYARAGRIMDMLEQKGVVGPPDGSKPREVLLDADGLEELRSSDTAFGGV